jgi:tRNA threonylcarbamoyladenosine biosynthesis protein TsaE
MRRCGAPAGRPKTRVVPAAILLALALPDENATAALAVRLAARAARGDVIALAGPLGSGKTSFARAFIRARCGSTQEVPSPTFTLVQVYDDGRDDGGPPIWHFDLFRLAAPEEAWELGIEDAFADGISLIEWPERLGALLPAERLEIGLSFAARPAARNATLTASAAWAARLAGLGDV